MTQVKQEQVAIPQSNRALPRKWPTWQTFLFALFAAAMLWALIFGVLL